MKLKDVKRIKEIIETASTSGLSYYLYKSKLSKCVSLKCRIKCWYHGCFCPPDEKSLPVLFRRTLERLGPTFIKLGQLLSVRPDFIPNQYCEELRKLQDDVPGFSYEKVQEIFASEFGKSISNLFSSFSEFPIASASIAQVHEAKLKNGKKVAVKVQRPEVIEKIMQDLRILHWIADFIEKHWDACRSYRPKNLAEEFHEWTERELDFRNEAKSMARVKDNFKENLTIVIPEVIWDLTTRRVLTMSYLTGRKLYDENGLRKLGVSKKKLAINGAKIMLEQTIVHGIFHADPHPGNLLAMKDNRLGFMDFGIIGMLSVSIRKKMLLILFHFINQNFERAIDYVLEISETSESSHIREYRSKLYKIYNTWYASTLGQSSLSQTFYKSILIGTRYNVYFPPDLVLFFKALVTTESVGILLYSQFDFSVHAKSFVEQHAKSLMSPVKSVRKFVENSLEYGTFIENFPAYVDKMLKKIEEPERKIKINTDEFYAITKEIHESNRTKTLGFIAGSLIISSAILLHLEGKKDILGISIGTYLALLSVFFVGLIFMRKIKKR